MENVRPLPAAPAAFAELPPPAATIMSTAPGLSVACESSITSTKEHRMSVKERNALLAPQNIRKREEIVKYLIQEFYKHTFFIQGFYAPNNIEAHYHHMWDEACAAHGYIMPLESSKQNVSNHLKNYIIND